MNRKIYLSLIVIAFLICQGVTVVKAAIAAEPTVQTFSISAVTGSCDEIDLTFVPGDGSRRIVIASPDVPVNAFPVDAVGYSSSSLYGFGSNLGNNNYVVYSGSGTSTTISGLEGGTQYFFAVFEFNGFGSNANYLLTGYPEASAIAAGITMTITSTSGDMCQGDSVKLEVHGAETYSWSPSGSLSSSTDSVVWAHPGSTTNYTVTGQESSSGCSDQKSLSITVYSLPNVNLPNLSDKCMNTGIYTLPAANPVGGTYSGDGVSGNEFDPMVAGAGLHVITYTYSDIHGCTDKDEEDITVFSSPAVTFSALNPLCEGASNFTLTGGSPSGGNYSGTGVSGGQFHPSTSGSGSFVISYIYSDGTCADTAQSTQIVHALPNVTFATLQSVCLNTQPFNLAGGSPSGGAYSGSGITSGVFSPLVTGAGNFILTYSFTDSNGCSSEDTSNITVHTLPSVGFSALSPVCQNTGPITLSGGTPTGGTYSGSGVGGGIFYSGIAGPGQHTITYSYTNANNCTNIASQTMTVNAAPHPDLGPDVTVCADASVHLNGGSFSSYSWSTGGNSASIDLDTTNRGLGIFSVILTVTNNSGCANRDTIRVTFDLCNGIVNAIDESRYVAYPNPSDNFFTVVAEPGSDISVFDMNGALLYDRKNVPSIFTIGQDFPAGTYLMMITNKDGIGHKLVVKN